MATSTIARQIAPPDVLLAELQAELAEVLTPGRYDRQRATELQAAIGDTRERANRYRRMRRAVVTITRPSQTRWFQ